MPILSPYTTHPAVMGFGTLSVMGATPAALSAITANAPCWINSTAIAYQDYTTTAVLKKYDTVSHVITTLDGSGASILGAGGDIWGAYLSGSGVRSSVGGLGPFPLGGISATIDSCGLVSENGSLAFVTTIGTGSGISVYGPTGTSLVTITTALTSSVIYIRQNIVSYQDAAGWHLVNALTGAELSQTGTAPQFLARPNITKLIPFTYGTTVGVMEYQTGTNTLTIRPANQLVGLTIPTVGTEFNPDVQGVDSTHVRVAWSLTPGEAPADLIILDIDTATKATSKGTVVGSSIVFATGPTLTGTSFSGSTAAGNRMPVQSVKFENSIGEVSKPWRDFFQNLSGGVQTVQTAQNNTPVQMPQNGFTTIGGVSATAPGGILSLTSVDGSVTITPTQATQTVDLSVVTAGRQWIPLVTGAEPPVLVGDGSGHLVLVAYP